MQGILLDADELCASLARAGAALNAAQACIPPGKWPCSEFCGMMLQRWSPGLT